MSLHEYESVNSTVIDYDVGKSLLTPGQIAFVTISTTFAFYMTIMFLVCMGEYCKYVKRKKEKMEWLRKHSQLAAQTSSNWDNLHTLPTNLETSIDQSSASTYNSDSSFYMDKHRRSTALSASLSRGTKLSENIVEVHFEPSLNQIDDECGDGCEIVAVNMENDIAMVPLISKQCEDMLDVDGDIFCDSQEIRTLYPLEADV